MKEIFLSVVIPSYDEMVNLQKGVLNKVKSFLEKKKISYEVLIIDDGSKDGSIGFVENFVKVNKQFILVNNPHLGKAGAVTTGMLRAKGKYVLFTDMDQATPIEEVDTLLPVLEKEHFDIAIGSRKSDGLGYPFSRLILHEGMIVTRKLIVGLPSIYDTQCGFKMFTRASAQKIFSKLSKLHNGFRTISGSAVKAGFDVELLYIAQKMGYTIKEVPVHWLYVETRRVNPIQDSIDGILYLLKIRMNALQNIYK
ncbi:MAG: glycosyltransferase [Candidatus Levyibacteriota bacterium]